ncbi:glycoside hydrolase [Pararhizobium sp. BT-229]|uniref:glycoside hydrolase n=1 Tax=Pararhizobium sp. BT-229 TaxID=2986923 RepID=UPI0021F7D291|nr:glycoside hydrolase [Pararhizobium sp. BT-229]MCV9966678.1 glycoside hydrolase [Pararhizobium sp. BT-229]
MKRALRWATIAMLAVPLPVAASDEWLPVRETSMVLGTGSPLDFSALLPNPPIDDESRLITGDQGRLIRAGEPEKPVRLLCASLAWSPASGGFPDHADADRYAAELAKHGYNIARLHLVDASLMFGRERDFDFDPEVLDRVHYLLAALKRNGIYWIMDGLSSWRGAYGGYDDRWDPSSDLKLALYFDDKAFDHWLEFQRRFLTAVNPYTGIAPIDDKALALVILVNENNIEFDSIVREREGKPHYDERLKRPFSRWLVERYGSTEALARAWPDLGAAERLEDSSVELPGSRYKDSPRLKDLQAFFVSVETATADRMSKALRDLGYKGEISSFNNWPTIQTTLSRRDLPVITMNTYQDWVGSYAPGATITQKSSIADGANYMRMIAAARWLGRPFAVSEYDHLFWSRYRYEAGLVMPAYAAFQGWDVLCRHGHGPIILKYNEPYAHKKAMLPYAIALDPVARAGETLAALLYRRGDVSASKLTIPFLVRGTEDLDGDMQAREPERLTDLALVGAIGMEKAEDADGGPAVGQPRSSVDPQAVLDAAKSAGLLSNDNQTDLKTGLYESDTGELLFDRLRGQLRVSTPKTEALAFSTLTQPVDLGSVTVEASDGDGLIAVSVLDDAKTIPQSRRLLVIYATDARNSGMRFADDEEKVIADFGRLPVLIRKGTVDLSLNLSPGTWRLTPVTLNGMASATAAKTVSAAGLRISNETTSGPTTFFLLEAE